MFVTLCHRISKNLFVVLFVLLFGINTDNFWKNKEIELITDQHN